MHLGKGSTPPLLGQRSVTVIGFQKCKPVDEEMYDASHWHIASNTGEY